VARQAIADTSAQPVKGDGDQPGADVAFFLGIDGVRGAPAELLDQPSDVHRGDVGPQASITVGPGDDFREACHAPAGGGPHLSGRIDLPGERGQRSGAHLNAGPDVTSQPGPWVAGSKRLVRGAQGLFHRQHAKALQQLRLAAVAAVEGAHADPGTLGDGGDGRACTGRSEDVTCRVQHGQVVAPRLRLTTAAGKRAQRA